MPVIENPNNKIYLFVGLNVNSALVLHMYVIWNKES